VTRNRWGLIVDFAFEDVVTDEVHPQKKPLANAA
jgi:hypothetical protein